MVNLLQETESLLSDHGHSSKDVQWVGNGQIWFTWDEFMEIADTNYDNGFGGQQVAQDLIVVGKYWWLERHEYDGSEWWAYQTYPTKPDQRRVPPSVVSGEVWWNIGDGTGKSKYA